MLQYETKPDLKRQNLIKYCAYLSVRQIFRYFHALGRQPQISYIVNNTILGQIIILDMHVQNKKYENFVSISRLTGKCATQKIENFCSSSLWTCLHHMVILKSQNNFFSMILAWLCPFKTSTNQHSETMSAVFKCGKDIISLVPYTMAYEQSWKDYWPFLVFRIIMDVR